MHELKQFTTHELKMNPEQAQVLLQLHGTYSACYVLHRTWTHLLRKRYLWKRPKRKTKEIVVEAKTYCGKAKVVVQECKVS